MVFNIFYIITPPQKCFILKISGLSLKMKSFFDIDINYGIVFKLSNTEYVDYGQGIFTAVDMSFNFAFWDTERCNNQHTAKNIGVDKAILGTHKANWPTAKYTVGVEKENFVLLSVD